MASGLSNITKYAAGPRNIDAMVDAMSNGEDPNAKKPEASQQAPEQAHPEHKDDNHHKSWMDKVKHIFGENEHGAEPGTQSTQVASNDLGMQAVREGLGTDAQHLSDDQIRATLGNDLVAQIGEQGFPHEEVNGIQQGFSEHGLDKMEALQTYVAAVNSQPGDKVELQDQQGNSTSLDADQVLQTAGLSRNEVEQARGQEEAGHENAGDAGGAEMSMA